MISTRKLAELAGVSQSTVSRSLNDRPEISPDTKERIRALARANGYVVRQKARKTVCSPARKAIGVLMMRHMFFDDLFINQLVCVLNSFIEEENYYAMPLLDYGGEAGIDKLRDLLALGLIEGFIIINREYDETIDRYFNYIGIPHVYLIYHLRHSTKQANIIDTDNFAGGYLATKHLIDLGHRRIATVTSPLDEFADRTGGYREALREFGILYDPSLVFTCAADYQSTYATISAHRDAFQDATALFAQFDVGALASINALADHGLRVPGDVSVIGLDGLDIGEMHRPSLTSIRQPFQDLARHAVDRLLQAVNMPNAHVQGKTFLRPELILRNSTGPCGRKK